MNTKVLEYILAIAETRSVSQAADRFLLSQPLLSKHLKKIEAEFGAPLFTRDKAGMTLTPAGILFVNNAQAVLHAERELERKLEVMRRQQKASIRLLVDLPYQTFFVRRILPRFRELYPAHYLHFEAPETEDVQRALLEGAADLAILAAGQPVMAGLHTVSLTQDEMVMVLPEEPEGTPSPTWQQLPDWFDTHRVVGLHRNGTAFRTLQEAWLSGARVNPHTVLEFVTFREQQYAMELYKCCALFPQKLAQAYGLSRQLSAQPPQMIHILLARAPQAVLRQPVEALYQIIREEFAGFNTYVERRRPREEVVFPPLPKN